MYKQLCNQQVQPATLSNALTLCLCDNCHSPCLLLQSVIQSAIFIRSSYLLQHWPDGTSESEVNNDVVTKLRLDQKLLNVSKKENQNTRMHQMIPDDPICEKMNHLILQQQNMQITVESKAEIIFALAQLISFGHNLSLMQKEISFCSHRCNQIV